MTTAPLPHDDLSIPPMLTTALVDAAATVPAVTHDLGSVHRRAARHHHRRVAVTSLAAAAALVVGGLGVVRLTGLGGSDPDVVVPASVSGYATTSESPTLLVPLEVPAGWTLVSADALPYPGELPGPATSQLFAADGRPPLGRGVVVTSTRALDGAGDDGTDDADATHTIRGRPAMVDGSGGELMATWSEDGVDHIANAVGLPERELLDFLESLVPHDDPVTGFTAPASAGTALAERDTVVDSEQLSSLLVYAGPDGEEVEVSGASPGIGSLLRRLDGTPYQGGLLARHLDGGTRPEVLFTRADGWTASVAVEAGSPDPAVLDAIAAGVEPRTVGELVDDGRLGPVTDLAEVDGTTVEVHGSDAGDLALCVIPADGDPVCGNVAAPAGYRMSTASLVVDGRWTVVTVVEGDEPGQIIAEPEEGWGDPIDPNPGEVLDGPQARSGDRTVTIVTVPDEVDALVAQSPMTDLGSTGRGYFRPSP